MDTVIRLIKEKGQRFTPQKKSVLHALKQHPQTVLEILATVNGTFNNIDKVTIYRVLTGFVKLGIVREIHLGDRETRYEMADCKHHHHLVCEECKSIEDVALYEDSLLREVQKQSTFQIKSHSLEFFGICKKCQKK